MADRYCIKEGYGFQKSNYTIDINRNEVFWNQQRIASNLYYQYHVYRYAREIIKTNHLASVVDLGCGVGRKLEKLIMPVCSNICGIDQEEAVAYCRNNYMFGQYHVDDLEHPSIDVGKFDLIICADVIEHLLNPDHLLAYIRRLCTRDSMVILSTPDRDRYRGENCTGSDKPEHVREWTSSEFAQYLAKSGYSIVEHKLVPFVKFTLKRGILDSLLTVYRRSGTIRSCQLVVCRP